MDLRTQYLGLELKNPIVASSSPLTWDLATTLKLQDAGVGAIIMPSLFEEQIEHEQEELQRFVHQQSIGCAEAEGFHPALPEYEEYQEKYLNQVGKLKAQLDIPVIASLNGTSNSGWLQYAKEIEQAGADALELNVYYIAGDPNETSVQVEQRYFDVYQTMAEHINIPVCMKLSHQFSSLIPFVKQLESLGVAGVSLFNRFYQPDINLDTLQVEPQLELSHATETLLRIRWIAMLRCQVSMSLSITGGVHGTDEVLKSLLAGADITCMCSTLLNNGPAHVADVLAGMTAWMEEKEYDSVSQLKGSLSYANAINPSAYERANYLEVLDSYSYASGVMV